LYPLGAYEGEKNARQKDKHLLREGLEVSKAVSAIHIQVKRTSKVRACLLLQFRVGQKTAAFIIKEGSTKSSSDWCQLEAHHAKGNEERDG